MTASSKTNNILQELKSANERLAEIKKRFEETRKRIEKVQ
jgi:hypothetical protein